MSEIKRILVVSRMTEFCREALHYGISLAKAYEADLYFIHCMHDLGALAWLSSAPVWVVSEDYKKLLSRNREEMDTLVEVEKEKGLRITELIKKADPVQVILEAVADESIDLIVMAAHEEGRLEHVLFGHCTEEIVRKMPCSILLVKAKQAAA